MKGDKSGKPKKASNTVSKKKKTTGPDRKYDREAVLKRFAEYIDSTPVPFIASFCSMPDIKIPLTTFMEWKEGEKLRGICKTKEESGLLELGIRGKAPIAFVLFVLKNLGYSDTQAIKHSGEIKTDSTLKVVVVDPEAPAKPAKPEPKKKK